MKVALFGDRMKDVYYIGDATRLSPEHPTIPVIKIYETREFPGGAANVAANLKALDVEVQDFMGNPEIIKNRLLARDIQVARWDQNDTNRPPKDFDISGVDAIVISDYAKGGVPANLSEMLHDSKIPIFVDTKRSPIPWSGLATAIFPNGSEYNKYVDSYKHFQGRIILKCGQYGLQSIHPTFVTSPSVAKNVRSVTGAGDTVLSAAVVAYLRGYDWQDILDFANAAAAISVENPFTSAPTLAEVEGRFQKREL